MDVSGNSLDIAVIKNELSVSQELFAKGAKGSKTTGLIRKLVCDHQGSIIEHIYWAAEIHKELRLSLDSGDSKLIRRKIRELDNDLPAIFQNAWRITVSSLNDYFALSHKSSTLPRMCIKATTTKGNEKYIVDVFREDGGISSLTYKVCENTGFHSVQKDGKYYKCDSIPKAVIKGNYINPRLNPDLAKRYKPSAWRRFKQRLSRKRFDEDWAECWIDYEPEKGNWPSCYKSTLIIPMTLINNHQSSKFIQNTMVGVSKDARSIYGFLCFDHTEEEYFNDDDINIGYIAADLLSFYMINELNFTEYSSTYEKAKTR